MGVDESDEANSENENEVSDQLAQEWYRIPGDMVDADESTSATPTSLPPMDDLLTECFYMAIKSSISRDDLPMLTSTFYRSHMMQLW